MARKTLFIFPPFAESALLGPHLAPGLLTAILRNAGEGASTYDLNIRLVHEIFSPQLVREAVAAVRAILVTDLSPREDAALDWLVQAARGGWYVEYPATVRYVLRVVRRALFPVPPRLEDCFSDATPHHPLVDRLYRSLLATICQEAPTTIGLSVAFSEQLCETVAIARMLRRLLPNTVLLLGGSQINLLQAVQLQHIVNSNVFDAVLLPNGETGIVDLAKCGVTSGSTSIVRSRAVEVSDLAGLPQPVFDSVSLYFRPLTIPVLATKGCYWGQCSFCDYVHLSDIGGKRYLARPADEALQEIRFAQDQLGAERINLISDAVPPAWYSELAAAGTAQGVSLRTWSYMMHHEHMDRRFFQRLADAGVHSINFGTETTNDRILQLMKKQASSAAIRRNFEDAFGAGIRIIANVIPDYPTTTFDESMRVAADFEELAEFLDTLNPSMFDLTSGTPAAITPSLHEIKVREDVYGRSSHGFHTLSFQARAGLTEAQRLALQLVYKRLASGIRLKNRVLALAWNQASKFPMMIRLDRGALISASDSHEVKMPAIDATIALSAGEAAALQTSLSNDGGWNNRDELSKTAEANGLTNADAWIERLSAGGMVDAVFKA